MKINSESAEKDAVSLLKASHQVVSVLFKKYEKSESKSEKRT